VSLPLSRSNAFGETLPSINLGGASADVVPQFANSGDYDSDGTPNTAEFSLGTNPFSEMSGPAGIGVGVVVSNESAGSNCEVGGQKLLFFRDMNNNGLFESGEAVVSTSYLCGAAPAVSTGGSGGRKLARSAAPTTVIGTFAGSDETTLPMLQIAAGYRLPLVKQASTWIPLRVPLFFENADCSGTTWAKAIGFGQGVYTHKDGYPYVLVSSEPLDRPLYMSLWESSGCKVANPYLKEFTADRKDQTQMVGTAGGYGYFWSNDLSGGGLYKTNGTDVGTTRLLSLAGVMGSYGSSITSVAVGSRIFFSGYDLNYGHELWTSDGTAVGTVRITDMNVGSGGSSPQNFVQIGSYIYFAANSSGTNLLYRIPSSTVGAVTPELITEVSGGTYSVPWDTPLAVANGKLFFVSSSSIMVHDPSTTTLAALSDLGAAGCTSTPSPGVGVGGFFQFACSTKLFKTDGTTTSSYVNDFNDSLFRVATDAFTYRCDGTFKQIYRANGTALVALTTSSESCANSNIVGSSKLGANYYFVTNATVSGSQVCNLWKSDGATAATAPLKTLSSGYCSALAYGMGTTLSTPMIADGATNLYILLQTASQPALWRTDGTAGGTSSVFGGYAASFSSVNGFSLLGSNFIWNAHDSGLAANKVFRFNTSTSYSMVDYGHGFSVATPLAAPVIGAGETLSVVP
jgi:ELWxxDGT repeat protein